MEYGYAMAKDLNIERRDIKACLSAKLVSGILDLSIVIYDSVPGGAGPMTIAMLSKNLLKAYNLRNSKKKVKCLIKK